VTIASKMGDCSPDEVEACKRYATDPHRITVYAEKIIDAAQELQMRSCLRECQQLGLRGRAMVQAVQDRVMAIGASETIGASVKAGVVSQEIVADCERRIKGDPPRVSQVTTGVIPFDEYMALERGGVMCVAARPSMGKTAYARMLIKGFIDQGERIHFVTTENNRTQMINDFISDLTGICSRRIATKALSRDEMAEVRAADAVIRGWPLWIDDERNELLQIKHELNRLKHAEGVTMLVVDHLQELRVADRRIRDERGTVNALMTGLRDACRNSPRATMVILSQLNRKVEDRTDKRPLMSDLRESGKIEDVADMIILLYRESYYDKTADNTKMQAAIAKNKYGPTGLLRYKWDDSKGLIDGVFDEFSHLWPTRLGPAPPPPTQQRQAPQQRGLI
jgi:replicative DNA helicase